MVAVSALLAAGMSGCGGRVVDTSRAVVAQEHVAASACSSPTIDAPDRIVPIISTAASRVGACSVTAVRFGAPDAEVKPLPGYPGDQWLYLKVGVDSPGTSQVEADWEAARLAGEVRNATAAGHLATPFGYSIIPVLPTGTELQPFDIVIGASIGTRPSVVADTSTEAARVRKAADAAGLSVRGLTFRGQDRALAMRASFGRAPADLLASWPAVLQSIVGRNPTGDWIVEIDDPAGSPIKVVAGSVSTAGVVGWTRPDLRGPEAARFR